MIAYLHKKQNADLSLYDGTNAADLFEIIVGQVRGSICQIGNNFFADQLDELDIYKAYIDPRDSSEVRIAASMSPPKITYTPQGEAKSITVTPAEFWAAKIDPAKQLAKMPTKLQLAMQSKISQLKGKAESVIEHGAVTFAGKIYSTSNISATRVHGLLKLAELAKGPAQKKVMDNSGIRNTLTQAQLADLGAAIAVYQDSVYTVLETKIAEVKTLTDVYTVNDYNIEVGWP